MTDAGQGHPPITEFGTVTGSLDTAQPRNKQLGEAAIRAVLYPSAKAEAQADEAQVVWLRERLAEWAKEEPHTEATLEELQRENERLRVEIGWFRVGSRLLPNLLRPDIQRLHDRVTVAEAESERLRKGLERIAELTIEGDGAVWMRNVARATLEGREA